MTLRITPAALEGMYEYLRATAPFCRWRLPPADEVVFVVTRQAGTAGYYTKEPRKPNSHEIGVSERCVGSTQRLAEIMAHEMLHLKQEIEGSFTSNAQHNAEFHRLTKEVCKAHLFDPLAFT